MMTDQQIRAFYTFLQGGAPPREYHLQECPHLTSKQAFSVLYLLQEEYRLIPDYYERCDFCDALYNTRQGGGHLDADMLAASSLRLVRAEDIDKFACDGCFSAAVEDVDSEE